MFTLLLSAAFQLITIIVILDVLLSYILSPYHPLRMNLDKIVGPLLKPIQKYVPPFQMIDFSPVILIILLQIIQYLLVGLISGR
jgi:YggT family protein